MTIYIDDINTAQKTIYVRVDETLTAQDIVDYFTNVDEALDDNAGFTEHIDFTATVNFNAQYGTHTDFTSVARKIYETAKYTKVICIVKNDQQFGSVRMYASLFRLTNILEIKRLKSTD